MKTNINYILMLLIAVLFVACEKNQVQQIDVPPSGAFLRVSNFAVGGPTVNVYANDKKLTAIGSLTGTEASTGIAAYGIYPGTNSYINVTEIGNVNLVAKTPSTAPTNPNTTTTTVPATLEAGKYYSFYTSGIYDATTKTSSGFVIEDVIPAPDTAFAYVRIINTIPNATNGFNLNAVNTTNLAPIAIAAPTAYKATSAFTKVPNGVYDLTSTSVATPANIVITRAAVSFSKGFVYTIAARGNALTASTRALDLTRNR